MVKSPCFVVGAITLVVATAVLTSMTPSSKPAVAYHGEWAPQSALTLLPFGVLSTEERRSAGDASTTKDQQPQQPQQQRQEQRRNHTMAWIFAANSSMAHVLDANRTLAVCELALLHFRFCAFSEGLAGCLARLGGAARVTFALPSKCTKARAWRRLLEEEKAAGANVEAAGQGLPELSVRVPRQLFYDPSRPVTQRLGAALPESRHVSVLCDGCRRFSLGYAFPRENHIADDAAVGDEFFDGRRASPERRSSEDNSELRSSVVSRAKVFSFLQIVPREITLGFTGSHRKFGARDEWLMTQLYRHSYYVATHRRGGWDARRHHEILFAGAVPYFLDMTDMPPTVMPALPRNLIASAMALDGPKRIGTFSYRWGRKKAYVHPTKSWQHGKMKQWLTFNTNHMPSFDVRMLNKTAYFDAADRVFTATRERMTTDRLAAHFLRSLNITRPKRLLFFFTNEYQSQMLLHGLADLGVYVDVVGVHSDDYIFKRPYRAFKTYEEVEAWWPGDDAHQGNGWYLQSRVDPRSLTCFGRLDGNNTLNTMLSSYFPADNVSNSNGSTFAHVHALASHRYDAVLYSLASQMPVSSLPLYKAIRASGFPPVRIALLDYLDYMDQPHPTPCSDGVLFKRELACHPPKWL